jgi:putative resolvase
MDECKSKRSQMVPQILTMQAACKCYGIPSSTLRKWADQGHVNSTKSPGGVRLFHRNDLEKLFGSVGKPTIPGNKSQITNPGETKQRTNVVYCRVSSVGQKDDLERQIEFLHQRYPEHRIIQDIGSGLNFNRKGLQTILELAMQRNIGDLVVAYKDRLARFGFELIQYVIELSGGRVVVLDDQTHKSGEQELAEDLMSIIHVFNCRQMGKRKYTKRSQVSILPNQRTETVAS